MATSKPKVFQKFPFVQSPRCFPGKAFGNPQLPRASPQCDQISAKVLFSRLLLDFIDLRDLYHATVFHLLHAYTRGQGNGDLLVSTSGLPSMATFRSTPRGCFTITSVLPLRRLPTSSKTNLKMARLPSLKTARLPPRYVSRSLNICNRRPPHGETTASSVYSFSSREASCTRGRP